jgi:hypothetical protein
VNHYDEYLRIAEKVRVLMDWDYAKTTMWMIEENPSLGDVSPTMMIITGKIARLERFINEVPRSEDSSLS